VGNDTAMGNDDEISGSNGSDDPPGTSCTYYTYFSYTDFLTDEFMDDGIMKTCMFTRIDFPYCCLSPHSRFLMQLLNC
jgi:hypothetical protein